MTIVEVSFGIVAKVVLVLEIRSFFGLSADELLISWLVWFIPLPSSVSFAYESVAEILKMM